MVARAEGAARGVVVRAAAVALEATSWRGALAMAMAVVASLRAGHGSQGYMVEVAVAAEDLVSAGMQRAEATWELGSLVGVRAKGTEHRYLGSVRERGCWGAGSNCIYHWRNSKRRHLRHLASKRRVPHPRPVR